MASRCAQILSPTTQLLRGCTINRAKRGIYMGKTTAFGNTVSHSKQRERRMWKPNVQRHTLTSDILDRAWQIPITTTTLRTIKKAGSFDKFLLSGRRIQDSPIALELREKIIKTKKTGIKPKPEDYKTKGLKNRGFAPRKHTKATKEVEVVA